MPNVSGTYTDLDGAPTVRFERTFPHPRAAVWAAITEPTQLQTWFPTTVEYETLAAGAPITFRFPQDAYPPMTGSFRTVEPPDRLQFTWGEDLLTFELEDADDDAHATRLAFTVVLDDAGKAARDGAGWEACLDKLELVAGGDKPDHPGGGGPEWQSYYEHYKGLGFPATAEVPE